MNSTPETDDFTHIPASSSLAEETVRVLKDNETFAVFNRYGDIDIVSSGEQGVYNEGTRHLSRLLLTINGECPLLLSSNVNEDNATLAVDLTNPDFFQEGTLSLERGAVYLNRLKFLHAAACYEQISITNYSRESQLIRLELQFAADFKDIFEVRGIKRNRRGVLLPPDVKADRINYTYHGLDGITRSTHIVFSIVPRSSQDGKASFELHLKPHETRKLEISAAFNKKEPARGNSVRFADAYRIESSKLLAWKRQSCLVVSSNEQFNDWLTRSSADLQMMISATPWGGVPYAGVPWFSAPFGRDSIITAMQMLWLDPQIARATLVFLAHHQAQEFSEASDSEPGKILHEARTGEMANLGEIPYKQYYGSVDATPLYLMLAGAYWRRTADTEFIGSIWDNLRAAMEWIDNQGDGDGDGFVEYHRQTATGLVNQGWKDSEDSVFHADGRLAEGPIALVEVQAYVYAAKLAMADIAAALGYRELEHDWRVAASHLREKFAAAFWMEERACYALALDKDKSPCSVLTSNAGHALYAGIAYDQHAHRLATTLMSPAFFSGWGVRTVAEGEARYNPMTYHNGTVWPHDNAIIAAGFARYGLKQKALAVLSGMFDTAVYVDLRRLPELFCGFSRIAGQAPTLYPLSCAPQSWAAGAVYMLLGCCLGIDVEASSRTLTFRYPVLPHYIQKLTLKNLNVVPGTAVDVELINHKANVGINVLERRGGADIVIIN